MIKKTARLFLEKVSNTGLYTSFLKKITPRLIVVDEYKASLASDYLRPGKYISLLSRFNRSSVEIFKLTDFSFVKEFRMKLDVNEYTQCGYFFGFLDNDLVSIIRKGGGTFVDIGANVGMYSLLSTQTFDKVFSFEPSKHTFELLKNNIELNNDVNNITLVNKGISDKSDIAKLYHNPLNNGGASLSPHAGASEKTHAGHDWSVVEEVQTDTLDNLLTGEVIDHVDLIKIDVEGHEISAIKGALKIIELYKPALYVEVSGKREKTAEIVNLLPSGYSAYLPSGEQKLSIEDCNIPSDVLFLHESRDELFT